jgi:hypothetical protein
MGGRESSTACAALAGVAEAVGLAPLVAGARAHAARPRARITIDTLQITFIERLLDVLNPGPTG